MHGETLKFVYYSVSLKQ